MVQTGIFMYTVFNIFYYPFTFYAFSQVSSFTSAFLVSENSYQPSIQ